MHDAERRQKPSGDHHDLLVLWLRQRDFNVTASKEFTSDRLKAHSAAVIHAMVLCQAIAIVVLAATRTYRGSPHSCVLS